MVLGLSFICLAFAAFLVFKHFYPSDSHSVINAEQAKKAFIEVLDASAGLSSHSALEHLEFSRQNQHQNQPPIASGLYEAQAQTKINLASQESLYNLQMQEDLFIDANNKKYVSLLTVTLFKEGQALENSDASTQFTVASEADFSQKGSTIYLGNIKGERKNIAPWSYQVINADSFYVVSNCGKVSAFLPCEDGISKILYKRKPTQKT